MQLLDDPHNLGQKKKAEIIMETATSSMKSVWFDAFTTEYVNPEWRAMLRRIFYRARAEYDNAKAVWEAHQ